MKYQNHSATPLHGFQNVLIIDDQEIVDKEIHEQVRACHMIYRLVTEQNPFHQRTRTKIRHKLLKHFPDLHPKYRYVSSIPDNIDIIYRPRSNPVIEYRYPEGDISYGIACGPQAERFIVHLLESFNRTVQHSKTFKIYLGLTQWSNIETYQNIVEQFRSTNNITLIDCRECPYNRGSCNHGYVLNQLTSQMNTPYGLLSDCDICFLLKDWDLLFKSKITDVNVVLGTQYTTLVRKANFYNYQNFPNASFCFFDVNRIRELKFSWMPDLALNNFRLPNETMTDEELKLIGYLRVNESNQSWLDLPLGKICLMDTGFQLASIIRVKYDGTTLRFRYENRLFNDKQFKRRAHEYTCDEQLCVAHLATGHNYTQSRIDMFYDIASRGPPSSPNSETP